MHACLCIVGEMAGEIPTFIYLGYISERIKHIGSHRAEIRKPQPGMHCGGGCSPDDLHYSLTR